MLSFLIRRLAVTGVAVASLAAVGVFFGGASLSRPDAPIFGENAAISGLSGLDTMHSDPESQTPSDARRASGRRGPDIAWPFFSFSRQRAGGSW